MSSKAKTTGKSRREIRHAKQQRQQLLWRAVWGLGGVAVLTVIGYFAWDVLRSKPGQSLPQQARTHIQLGDQHEPYNSDPPTSGAHASPVQEGFYSELLPDESLVHNLEHGYVVIWYNCAGLGGDECQNLKTQIQSVIDRTEPVVLGGTGKKLIAVTRLTLDTPIALTSWGRLYKLDSFNEEKITTFIKEFRNQAPEPNAP